MFSGVLGPKTSQNSGFVFTGWLMVLFCNKLITLRLRRKSLKKLVIQRVPGWGKGRKTGVLALLCRATRAGAGAVTRMQPGFSRVAAGARNSTGNLCFSGMENSPKKSMRQKRLIACKWVFEGEVVELERLVAGLGGS
jgi:hypothetical protein